MESWTPKPYQAEAIEFCITRPCAGLFLDPGLGKTSISLATYKLLKKRSMVRGALIIAPLRPCYLVWPKEVKKWVEFSNMGVSILHGPGKDSALNHPADLYIINPEGLEWLSSRLNHMERWPFDVLIIDESTKFKNAQTKRFKTLKPLLDKFSRRYILTGTPAPRSLMDLFGQMYIVDRGASLGTYFSSFRKAHFYQTDFLGYEWALLPGAADRIHNAIASRVLRMDAVGRLDLPELIVNDVWVKLPPKAMKTYMEMEKILRTEVKSGVVTAANVGVAVGKCRQIASGGLFLSTGAHETIHTEKSEAVAELVEELGGKPALIGYEYKHDLERLEGIFGKDVPRIGGSTNTAVGAALERLWNAGELPVLLGQPQSMAHGLNLQESSGTIIWHTLPWDFELYDQFIRRIYRQGNSAKSVVVHRILAENTVDEAVVASLSKKERGQNNLFNALKEYVR